MRLYCGSPHARCGVHTAAAAAVVVAAGAHDVVVTPVAAVAGLV
jgi:hypothetical protein